MLDLCTTTRVTLVEGQINYACFYRNYCSGGNDTNPDTCGSTGCGDGNTDPNEQCDDANLSDFDGCNNE